MGQVHEYASQPGVNEISEMSVFVAHTRYDCAVDGGAQGAIPLMPSTEIPAGAAVLAAFALIRVVPTSQGAATIAIGVETATDMQGVTGINVEPYATLGLKALTKTFATNPVVTTAARNPTVTIGTADLDAGVIDVYIVYTAPGLG